MSLFHHGFHGEDLSVSAVFVHKLAVELDDAPNPFCAGGEEGGAEVQAAILLAETRAGNDADARGLEEAHAVKLVGGAALGGGSLGSLGREVDGGEEVHAALRRTALYALHLLKGLVKSGGALAKPVVNGVVLLLVQLVAWLAGLRGVDHEVDETLADDGGAEHDADKLVNLGLHLGVETDELKVAASVTALANHALGDGVERCQLDVVVGTRLFLLHLSEHALEADELANKDIGLVDFVGEEYKTFLTSKLDDGADVLLGQGGACRVAGVDDDNGAHVDAVGLGLLVGLLDDVQIGTPVLGLVQVVRDACGIQD